MKKMIFVRHGRAEDPVAEFSDFERSLTTKGKFISKQMARVLLENEKSIGTIITSPAFRALETALIFADEFDINKESIILYSNLYNKMNFQKLLEILRLAGEETDTVTLFGHNPSFSEITNRLCRQGCDFMPKCGIVGISFNQETWSGISQNTGNLEYFLKPDMVL
jgi:phosphohistidine phosphatase